MTLANSSDLKVDIDPDDLETWGNGFLISYYVENAALTLADAEEKIQGLLIELDEIVVNSLVANLHPESLSTFFHFPEEIGNACEQYLIYFVNFLKDIGVYASADITHETGNVLFRVTPDSKDVALETIHDALTVYLNLADATVLQSAGSSIEAQRLAANVFHLQSQLTLARAIVGTQNIQIEALQERIQFQHQALTTYILPAHSQESNGSQENPDRAEFLGGMVALTKYTGKGFEVNLAEVFRKLKAVFVQNK